MKKILTTLTLSFTISLCAYADSGAVSANGSGAYSDNEYYGNAIIEDYLHDKYFDREAIEQDRWAKWNDNRRDADHQAYNRLMAACCYQNADHAWAAGNEAEAERWEKRAAQFGPR